MPPWQFDLLRGRQRQYVDFAKRSQFLARYCFFFQLGAEELPSCYFTSFMPSIQAVLQILGARLNKCPACQLQYYDWRRARLSAD
jgi:hypothetical protein